MMNAYERMPLNDEQAALVTGAGFLDDLSEKMNSALDSVEEWFRDTFCGEEEKPTETEPQVMPGFNVYYN